MKTWCLYVLLFTAPYSTKGLEATLADLPPNGLVMNPESGIPPTVNLVCSYTVGPGETMQIVKFYKDGTTDADQIVGIAISDGNYQLQNAFAGRTDVRVTVSDPSFKVTIRTVTLSAEGNYYCKVANILYSRFSITPAQTLKLIYRPNPPQITRGPQVAIHTYRVSCSSDGGRPAPEIKWFKMQSSNQMKVALNETSGNVQNQGDTFLVESTVDVKGTPADPVELICQLQHDSLISQTTTKITVPESAVPPTTTTVKPTNWTAHIIAPIPMAPFINTTGNAWRTVSIVAIILAMCLFCIIAYLVFRIRSLSKLKVSEQQDATVITNNVTEHSNNVNTPFNDHVSTQRPTDHSSGFDGVYVDYDDTALANGYEELRRDNRLDGQYMELGEVHLPSTATNGTGDYNHI